MQAPDPIAFSVFGLDIRWYGILIAMAFITAITICYKRAPKHGIESDDILDLAIWMIPISIIGARAYYVIFEWDMYQGDIRAMLDIRAGGLAIHGGLIAGLITGAVFCKLHKTRLLEMADLIMPEVALAQAIGRWGNFFNSEAHGGPTDLPWGIMVDGQKVHPTFLYESIWCLLIFIFLIWLDNRRKFRGQISCLYGMLYSIERFGVEALRTDSLMIGSLKQAQVISACIFICCLALYIVLLRRHLAGHDEETGDVETDPGTDPEAAESSEEAQEPKEDKDENK
ncbi:MAG: prolipoprotein diacylglyceryl transferase [Eubacteriales bacterium]|nr:prolipoprotein diacylglyceryl transferase [Eubacteriales bacterium]